MFFQGGNKKNKIVSSLSQYGSGISSRYQTDILQERISLFISEKGLHCASVTVEAVVILPLFLMACITLLFLIQGFRIGNTIQYAISKTGNSISEVLYLQEINGLDSIKVSLPALQKGISVLAIREMVTEEMASNQLVDTCVREGREGLNFNSSSVSDGWVDIIVHYKLSFPFSCFPIPDIPVVQRYRVFGWVGERKKEKTDSQMVYITKTGQVYHMSRSCSYLTLSIDKLFSSALPSARNSGGAKYYSCEKCVQNDKPTEYVYVTSDGTKYHNSISCSSLTRSIQSIPISQVGTRSRCSRCGK